MCFDILEIYFCFREYHVNIAQISNFWCSENTDAVLHAYFCEKAGNFSPHFVKFLRGILDW